MFIQTEETPNPASLKFLPGCEVLGSGSADFKDVASATGTSPLAHSLFAIEGVTGVLLGADFVTVTKAESKEWLPLKTMIMGVLMDHFSAGLPVMTGEAVASAAQSTAQADDDPLVLQIKEILDTRVRPAVAADGGDVVFDSFIDGVVYLHMRGACAGCPSSTATLKGGIENLLRHFVPEVTEVRAV